MTMAVALAIWARSRPATGAIRFGFGLGFGLAFFVAVGAAAGVGVAVTGGRAWPREAAPSCARSVSAGWAATGSSRSAGRACTPAKAATPRQQTTPEASAPGTGGGSGG
ncbi:hypothetical protein [Micromonospora sp. 4G55]|uniref:hypothetical protein n=1 Tax=Micromonospora sp. 4G55 TaxID=2806102 RepID=UPI001EE44446|nr:hypothetical protein [Micromonospora sp. 4G55]